MGQLIKNGQFVGQDAWHLLDDEAILSDYALISLERWNSNIEGLTPLAQAGMLGLVLKSEETADMIGEICHQFAVIAIEFPKFTDGRGYSSARLLRERHGYKGDLRSVGDVLIDQLFFMKRCGFSSFDLRDDQDKDDALAALSTFSVTYQNDVQDKRPLFRRRG